MKEVTMNRARFAIIVLLGVALAQTGALRAAQTTPAVATAPPTLAEALVRATPPETGVALAVAAEKTLPPSGPPRPGAALSRAVSVRQVAEEFGRRVRRFGRVSALAPPTMAVLNTRPRQPDPYAQMPLEDALTLLAARLGPGQWKSLTGERGLGLSDLNTDDQRALFLAAVPNPLRVQEEKRDLTGERAQARLRLRRSTEINLPAQQPGQTVFVKRPGEEQERRYHLRLSPARQAIAGVALRTEAPNVPKKGHLDFAAPVFVFARPVALDGVQTVGDLLARIGSVTGTELYADRRYENKSVSVVGSEQTAPAGDLLQAVGFCLTATYRRVGPAFVLTDDLVGAGTRRQLLDEFAKNADAQRKRIVNAAADAVAEAHNLWDLDDFGDLLDLSEAQRKQATADRFYRMTGWVYLKIPFAQLTPAQQAAIRATPLQTSAAGETLRPDLSAPVTVTVAPHLEVLLPSLDGPAENGFDPRVSDLFRPSERQRQASEPKPPSPPPLADLLAPAACRAVFVRPRDAGEVNALVASMKQLGLNQLWLPVSGGLVDDVVAAALAATQNTGVSVVAAIDLFAGRPETVSADPVVTASLVDRTILGETSAEAQARVDRRDNNGSVRSANAPAGVPDAFQKPVALSPLAPEVRSALMARVKTWAARPGVAGLAWRETDPPGYDIPAGDVNYDQRAPLGYSEAARLAFLRQAHADPVDVWERLTLWDANLSLPNFDDGGVSETLDTQWRQFRRDAMLSLLRDLRAAALPSGEKGAPPTRLLVKERGGVMTPGDGWYGSWDDPAAPPPAFRNPFLRTPPDQPKPSWDAATQAKAQSRVAVVVLRFTQAPSAQTLAERLAAVAKDKPWDGFVLDFGEFAPAGSAAGGDAGTNPLGSLVPENTTKDK